MAMSCTTCKFLDQKLSVLYENDFWVYAFPSGALLKGHGLLIPRAHITSFNDLTIEDLRLYQKALNDIERLLEEEYATRAISIHYNKDLQEAKHLSFTLQAKASKEISLDNFFDMSNNEKNKDDTELITELESFLTN